MCLQVILYLLVMLAVLILHKKVLTLPCRILQA